MKLVTQKVYKWYYKCIVFSHSFLTQIKPYNTKVAISVIQWELRTFLFPASRGCTHQSFSMRSNSYFLFTSWFYVFKHPKFSASLWSLDIRKVNEGLKPFDISDCLVMFWALLSLCWLFFWLPFGCVYYCWFCLDFWLDFLLVLDLINDLMLSAK